MPLSDHKTKFVYTIGPASSSPETMLQMLQAGMDIARLNFSHGDFAGHKTTITHLRDPALRSMQQVRGYHIQGSDG